MAVYIVDSCAVEEYGSENHGLKNRPKSDRLNGLGKIGTEAANATNFIGEVGGQRNVESLSFCCGAMPITAGNSDFGWDYNNGHSMPLF
jgi:hypothetical protein